MSRCFILDTLSDNNAFSPIKNICTVPKTCQIVLGSEGGKNFFSVLTFKKDIWTDILKEVSQGYGTVPGDPGSPDTVQYLETVLVRLSAGTAVYKKPL